MGAELVRGRVGQGLSLLAAELVRGRVGQGPSLWGPSWSGAEFVRGRDVPLPSLANVRG